MTSEVIDGAIGYVRISMKDQSIYSIPSQRAAIIDYCGRNKLNLLALFTDDGESSYTFDRPNWLALESFIKEHKREVRYLIILDHDRFSRNLAKALTKIDQLEKKVGVKVLSVYEPISTDTNAPDTFLNRAFKLLLANNELLKIRERTRRGIRLARECGRVVNNAPFGYKNRRDENDQPIIVIDPLRAPIIKKMFEGFLLGVSRKEIVRDARQNGFTLKGRSVLTRVLVNPVYAGLIKIPASHELPGKIVQALHPPLISEATYWRVHEILTGRSKYRSVPREEIPLRGLIRCSCGAALTGGFSKGRKKYYLYYKCIREKKHNYRGEILHELFYGLLSKLSFTGRIKVSIIRYVREKVEESCRVITLTMTNNKRETEDIERKIEKVEEFLINDQIEPTTYKKWYNKLQEHKAVLLEEMNSLNKKSSIIWSRFEELLPLLSNIEDVFGRCNFPSKQKLIRKVFEAGLTYDGKVFIAPYIHPALIHTYDEMKESGLLLLEQPCQKSDTATSHTHFGILPVEEDKLILAEQQLAHFIVELIAESIVEKNYDENNSETCVTKSAEVQV